MKFYTDIDYDSFSPADLKADILLDPVTHRHLLANSQACPTAL